MIPKDRRQYSESAHLLWTFIAALSGVDDELERADLAATGLPSVLPCRLSGMALVDAKQTTWSLIVQRDGHRVESSRADRIRAELEPVFQEALRRSNVLVATIDGADDVRIPPSIEELGVQSLAVAPLRTLHGPLGMVLAGREKPEGFSRAEELILSTLAQHSATGLENIRINKALRQYSENLQDLVGERTEELRRSEERHRVLLEVNNAIIANLDRASLFQAITKTLRTVLAFDHATLTLLDPETDILKVQALASTSEGGGFLTVGIEFPREGSHIAPVFDRKQPVIRGHLEKEQPIGIVEILQKEGIHSVVSVPLMSQGEAFGSLNLGSCTAEAYSQADAEFLTEVGHQVALAVENMLAYEEISQLKARLEQENLYLLEEIKTQHKFEEIIGRSSYIKKLLHAVETVAPTDATALILGETGTGKELVARAIHNLSACKNQALIKVNCAALPAGLIESELFGHERGAFTGAVSSKTGRFELADRGTIFLDEIGDLPLDLQAKLLRVLQDGEFERVGGSRTIRVSVRVIAATNRELIEAMQEGSFREDLYYRLNVFPLEVPPLRGRKSDIPLLVRHFVLKCGDKLGKRVETIPQRNMDALQDYPWPGNVRELENVIERAMILSQGAELELGDWSAGLSASSGTVEDSTLQEMEREHILRVLKRTNWRLGGEDGAAQILGLKRTTLQGRMRKLEIRREA